MVIPHADSLQVLREDTLAQKLILAGHMTHAYSHTDAPCGHLVELLVGQYRTAERIVPAENKV